VVGIVLVFVGVALLTKFIIFPIIKNIIDPD
jgi:hypothetical protein